MLSGGRTPATYLCIGPVNAQSRAMHSRHLTISIPDTAVVAGIDWTAFVLVRDMDMVGTGIVLRFVLKILQKLAPISC